MYKFCKEDIRKDKVASLLGDVDTEIIDTILFKLRI